MKEEINYCDTDGIGDAKDNLFNRIVKRSWDNLSRWCFLNIWCRYCYRHVMRLLHRFNLHYAPPMKQIHDKQPDGIINHWCQWCGLRGTTVDYKHFKSIFN